MGNRSAYKPVVRWPACRCGHFHPPNWVREDWDFSAERGERVLVPECKKGLGCGYWHVYEYTPVVICERCERIGSRRIIRYRSACYMGDGRPEDYTLTMCMSCWNKYRPVIKREQMLRHLQYLSNKLRRKAREKRRAELDAKKEAQAPVERELAVSK